MPTSPRWAGLAARLGGAALVAVGLAGCAPPVPELPAPPFALEGPARGGYRTGLNLAVTAARGQLRERYGPLDADDLRLEDGTAWPDVQAFYAATVPDGFERAATASTDPDLYRLAVWARGRQVVAVAYVPDAAGPGASLSVLRSRE